MKVFAISDLHLSTTEDKPMEVFGGAWENYFEKIRESWLSQVGEEDVVLIAKYFNVTSDYLLGLDNNK